MREVCYCGWSGEIVDREPIYAGDGEWGLACPGCGHLDRLEWLPHAGRHLLLAEADGRRREREQASRLPRTIGTMPIR